MSELAVVVVSIVIWFVKAAAACVALFLLSLGFTRSQGLDFRQDVWKKIAEGNLAVATYRGLLIVALGLMLGLLGGCAPARVDVVEAGGGAAIFALVILAIVLLAANARSERNRRDGGGSC